MYEEGNDWKLVRELVELADVELSQLAPLMRPFMTSDALSTEQQATLGWLSSAALRASGSTLLLVEHRRIWDGEILARSTLEATLKFCYIIADKTEFSTRHDEYADDCFAVARIKDHEKARRLLEILADAPNNITTPIKELLISDSELTYLSSKYDQKLRRRIDTQWGFTGLIEHMARSGEALGRPAAGLLHGYSMASHIGHADQAGVGMAMEREYREPARRLAVERAHAARLISDQISFCLFRLRSAYKFIGRPIDELNSRISNENGIHHQLAELQTEWFAVEYGDEV